MAKAAPMEDPGRVLMAEFLKYLIDRMQEANMPTPPPALDEDGNLIPFTRLELKPAELAVIRQLLADNAITFASVQRGDFGQFAKQVADEFPVDEDGRVNFQ